MGMNLLIVDDSPVMRKMIIRTIQLSGLEMESIYEAGNGLDGLELLKHNPIDLLFIDVNMPVMNGLEMLKRVRENPETRDLAVLIISTESHEDRIEMINRNNAGFVHKPFTPEDLKDKILDIITVKG